MRQRLFVEAVALAAPLTGVGRYSERLLSGLLDMYPDLTVSLGALGAETLDTSGLDRYGARVDVLRNTKISRRAYRLLLAAGLAPPVERLFPGEGFDAALFPAFATYPMASQRPSLTILHDATVRSSPDDKSWWSRRGLAALTQRSLDRSRCAAVSSSARRDIETYFRVQRPLDVVYPICPPVRPPLQERADYVLCVGTGSPRKNVQLVVQAKQLLGAQGPDVVIVGMGQNPVTLPGVRFLGFLPDEELAALRAAAKAVIAPSFDEGFDLSVAEAIAVGTPVLASRIDVHEEVLGTDHPYFFDASSPSELAVLMARDDLRGCDQSLLAPYTADRVCRTVGDLLRLG